MPRAGPEEEQEKKEFALWQQLDGCCNVGEMELETGGDEELIMSFWFAFCWAAVEQRQQQFKEKLLFWVLEIRNRQKTEPRKR